MTLRDVCWFLVSAMALQGCGDHGSDTTRDKFDDTRFHRGANHYLLDPYGYYGPGGRPHVGVGESNGVEIRVGDMRANGDRVGSDLDVEYTEFLVKLNQIKNEMDVSKHILIAEYQKYLQGLRDIQKLRSALLERAIYINTLPGIPPKISLEDFERMLAATDESRIEGLRQLKDSLIGFLDFHLKILPGHDRLESLRTALLHATDETLTLELISSTADEIKTILPLINDRLERKSVHRLTEVWIDTSQLTNKKDKKATMKFLLGERKRGDHPGPQTSSDEIHPIFSLTVHKHSRHKYLRVFRDHTKNQIKIIGVCGSRRSNPYLFSFTCPADSRSMGLLSEQRRANNLADAVMRVTCFSKNFARHLVMSSESKTDRCSLSKWSQIASKAILDEPSSFGVDIKGKKAFKMLRNGKGCFSKDEADIEVTCMKKS
jgi:hypothetical protein